MIKTIKSVENLRGKKILLRLDLNVLVQRGVVAEEFRIKKSMPTLEFLERAGAKIIIIAHLDLKEGKTLEPIAKYLVNFFPKLRFVEDINSLNAKEEIDRLEDGGIILFENIRLWKGEQENDPTFAKHLASLADIYVNEAFSVSHRSHASIVGVTEYLPSYIGPLFETEIQNLSLAFKPPHPFLLILGGAKFETKLPLLKKFISIADNIFVGGALSNDFFKSEGLFVGDSTVSDVIPDLSEFLKSKKVVIPMDVRTQHKGFRYMKRPTEISVHEKIWDIGERTEKKVAEMIDKSSFVLWNGPLSYFEGGAKDGTFYVAEALAKSEAKTIIGGGDTIAAIDELKLMDKFSFVSTGGGAMLEFLAKGTLPGIDAIRANQSPVSWAKRMFSR